MTLVSVQTTGTLKNGMLRRTMWRTPTEITYASQIPRLFITRVLGFTSLCATPTFILEQTNGGFQRSPQRGFPKSLQFPTQSGLLV